MLTNKRKVESFFRTHEYLINHLGDAVSRKLMTEVNWDDRLIAIKGTRGVGKTTFLLQYASDSFNLSDRKCLYVNLNHFYFTTSSILDFARRFVELGGEVLLLDQIYKYPNWSKELKQCNEQLQNLKIVFTGSTVLELEGNKDISEIVSIYNLRGFSYREFLNIILNLDLDYYTLDEVVNNHEQIAEDIARKINPNDMLWDYMHHGYYPFFLEKKNFSENLLKTLNMMLEVDVLSIRQIEQSYLPKLRKLLYLIAQVAPHKPNISKLSEECDVSRATVTNYLEYLKSARLINMLYTEGEEFPKKPDLIYMHNTNLLFLLCLADLKDDALNETFFYNQVHHYDSKLYAGSKQGLFEVVDEVRNYKFKIDNTGKLKSKDADMYYVQADIARGKGNVIPLWIFGFLY